MIETNKTQREMVDHILDLLTKIYKTIMSDIPLEQLPADVTVSQLRVLLALHTGGPSHMRALSIIVGVVPSTATGIIDALVKKGLVMRKRDLTDRRQVICHLSNEGQKLTEMLWTWGESRIKAQFETFTITQLYNVSETVSLLWNNMIKEKEHLKNEKTIT
ncbi:MAG: MarR family winged helix-turn-helix transcriptional regulator [Alkaliphilus sp.]